MNIEQGFATIPCSPQIQKVFQDLITVDTNWLAGLKNSFEMFLSEAPPFIALF